MRFTRRLLDRRSSGAFALASVLAAGGAAASCSSSDEDSAPVEASSDASTSVDAPDVWTEVAEDVRDAGPAPLAPLPIVCVSPPCAKSLVTTVGAAMADLEEGFCALLDDGTVACWGANGAGQLGRGEEAGTLGGSPTAMRVTGLSKIVHLDHTCAVDESGGTWCWGTGPFLRDDANVFTTERTPVKLAIPPATRVSFGVGFEGGQGAVACATVSSGLLCWGSNFNAQLGALDTMPKSSWAPPQPILLPPGAPIRQLAIGSATFVLREDGTMLTWGANPPAGRMSPLFPDPYPAAVAIGGLAMVDLVGDDACATSGGRGYCWGGSDLSRALPEPIVTPEPIVQIATTRTRVIESRVELIVQPSRWCATTVTGAVYCWGFNESGQAGNGTQDYAFEAVRSVGLPEGAAQVKTSRNTTCALLTNGKVYCWGSNFYGQLGNGSYKGVSLVPEEVVLP